MVTGLWYTHIPNFESPSWFWRCKEHPCPLSPDLGVWRTLDVPDWGLASWSYYGYGHLSLIHLCSKFLLYLGFEGAKNIYILQVLIWGFGGCWRFLTGILHLDLDLDMVTGLRYTHDSNFGPLSWFWRCKKHLCSSSLHFGLWRRLKVPDWGLASWSWFIYCYLSFVHPCFKF